MKIVQSCATLLAALSVMIPAVSHAQYRPTGTRIGRPTPASPSDQVGLSAEDRGMRTTNAYAECLVGRHDAAIRTMMVLERRELSDRDKRLLSDSECIFSGHLQMPIEIIRGSIFRTLFFKDFADENILFSDQPVNYSAYYRPESETNIAYYLLDFASCVVRKDTDNALAFIYSQAGEAESDAALQALIPELGPCIPEGQDLQFSESILRAYFSEAFYWESRKGLEAAEPQAVPRELTN